MESIIVALITGGLSLVGVIISGVITSRKTETSIRINQAVTNTKLENIEDGVNSLKSDNKDTARDVQDLKERVRVIEENCKHCH